MLLTMLLPSFSFPLSADSESADTVKIDANAELTLAKGGADAIATMTFDDGIYDTALFLNQLLAEYGLEASIMLTYIDVDNSLVGTSRKSIDEWRAVFAEGYLEPQSHSMWHKNIHTELSTDEERHSEIGDSKLYLEQWFPEYDCLTYAVPYSNYGGTQHEIVNDYFYATSGGDASVTTNSAYSGKMQSLSPDSGVGYGGWFEPYMTRMQPFSDVYAESGSPENIVKYLEQCINNNGWFISVCHGVTKDGEEINTTDMNETQARYIFSAMQKYQNSGNLWVANFSTATKYVRERQNSTVSAYSLGGKYYVSVEMASETSDGLSLPADVFDYPLTVKLELPADWVRVSYTLNGETKTAKCVNDGSVSYAYIDVVPNSGEIEITDVTTDAERPDFIPGSYDQTTSAPNAKTAADLAGDTGYNVTFATWTDEDAFLAGAEPIAWYTADAAAEGTEHYAAYTDASNIGSGAATVGYVHFYSDVSNSTAGRVDVGDKRLTVNLAGYTWSCSSSWNISSSGAHAKAYFTVKNGTVYHTADPVYLRQDTTVIFENVIYDARDYTCSWTSNVIQDNGCELLMFKDSIVKIKGDASFAIGHNIASPYQSYLIFKNSDLVCEGIPGKPLFNISTSYYGYTNVKILFDRDSSVDRASNNWVSLTDGAAVNNTYRGFYKTQGLYFELGCRISEAAKPDYNMPYTYTYYNKTGADITSETAIGVSTVTAYANTEGGPLEVAVIVPEDDGISYTLPTADTIMTLSGTCIYDNTVTTAASDLFSGSEFAGKVQAGTYIADGEWGLKLGEDGLSTIMRMESIVWSPDDSAYDGITYGVWMSEADFMAGENPIYFSTSTDLDTAIIATAGDGTTYYTEGVIPGYVHLWSDLNIATEVIVGNTQKLVINLNQHVINSASGLSIGGVSASYPEASLTVKNGYFNITGGQISPRPDTELIFDSVAINVTASGWYQMIYDGGAALISYTDCKITLNSAAACWVKSPAGRLEFIGTDITVADNRTAPLFWVRGDGDGGTVYFDKDCTVSGNGNYYLARSNTLADSVPVELFFEEGVTFTEGAIPDFTYVLNADSATSTGTAINANGEDSSCNIAVVSADASVKYTDFYYKKEGVDSYSLIGDISSYRIIEWRAGGESVILTAWETPYLEGNSGSDYVLVTENGSTVKLYSDITVGTLNTFYDYDVTFDLNGYTATTVGGQITIGKGDNSTYAGNLGASWLPERDVRFISSSGRGTLVMTDNTYSAILARPGSNVYFENIDITVNKHLFNNGSARTVSLTNCTVMSKNSGYISAQDGFLAASGSEEKKLILDGTALKSILIAQIYNNVADTNYSVTVTGGSVLDNFDSLIEVIDSGAAPASTYVRYINIDVDTRFTSGVYNVVEHGATAAQYHSANVTWYSGDTPITDLTNYAMYEGGTLNIDGMYDGVVYYCYVKKLSVGSALQVNLTLSANFNLNFFADRSVILGITADGIELSPVEWEGKDKYTVEFPAHKAADAVTFEVTVLSDGITQTLTLDYSVLAYVEKLMASEYSDESKLLGKAAIAYVKEAYSYANATAPTELTDFSTDGVVTRAASGSIDNLTSAVRAVNLSISSDVKILLHIAEGYTGRVTVEGITYNVTGGLVEGKEGETIIAIGYIKAKDLFNKEVTVSAQSEGSDTVETAVFTLSSYVAEDTSTCRPLLDALYTYCAYAYDYSVSYPDIEQPDDGTDNPDVEEPTPDSGSDGKWDLPWDV
ncbi:MAG: polysaccharide deacetylase family protein [Clostridia bacterium]|nr:polysaccharide deacetylase family protein [Clostridia bacterium]